jgi:bacillithiol system protein YtxJ
MAWVKLSSQKDLERLIIDSEYAPVVLFKHSTRCSLSTMAMNRLNESTKKIDIHIIDVICNRDISDLVAQKFQVKHQSPQLIVLKQKNCSFHVSHMNISANIIFEHIGEKQN